MKILLIFSLLVLAAGFAVYWLDNPRNREPLGAVLGTFFAGVLTFLAERLIVRFFVLKLLYRDDAIAFAIRLNDEYLADATLAQAAFSGFFLGGLIKEGVKCLALEQVLHRYRRAVDEPLDPIIYACILSLGFVAGDVLLHVVWDAPLRAVNLMFVVSLAVIHLLSAVLMGNCVRLYWEARVAGEGRWPSRLWLAAAFLLPAVAHGVASFCIAFRTRWGVGVVAVMASVAVVGCLRLVGRLRRGSGVV